jgi:hypothetical protein
MANRIALREDADPILPRTRARSFAAQPAGNQE